MKKLTLEAFIEKAKRVHGNKYDYSFTDYKDSLTKIKIICPIHGEFLQTPQSHLRGNGCPMCANAKRGDTFRMNTEEFIKNAQEIHGNKYDYSKVNYINTETKVCIICPIHGEFWQTPRVHLNQKSGCPKCEGRNLTTNEIINEFKKIHGNEYDYTKVEYVNSITKVCITCPKHGEFWQLPSKHLLGQGCPICGEEKRHERKKLTTEEFIEKAKEVHGNKYNYSLTKYLGTYNDINIICPQHGIFIQRANDHLNGHGCPVCGSCVAVSEWENEVKEYVESLGIDIKQSSKGILPTKREIDILAPNEHIGIECDGLYWHCEKFRDKKYHLSKTNDCKLHGFRLIHIFEDEWINKKNIVKSILNNAFGKIAHKIYGRKCQIQEISKEMKRDFLNANHIQGNVGSIVNLGLFYENELVSVMTFGKVRTNLGRKQEENTWEMLRFCNKLGYTINGGASKLFKHFVEKYNPKKIVSYADRRYFNGKLYEKLGFEHIRNSQPNYFYLIGKERKNRFSFRKDILVTEGFDKTKTEHQIMLERGIYRIYDCGCLVYEWKRK